MLFDAYSPQEAERQIQAIITLLKQGVLKEGIAKQLKLKEFDELFSNAKARLTTKKTSSDYFMTEDDLRFGTNEHVAAYRAKRLACDTLVDIGCGIGIQTIAFAKTCKKVIAVDIDARKVRYAQENARKHKMTNIEFITDDGLAALERIPKADVVFVDPERAPEEDVRDIAKSFKPNLHTLIKTATTKNIAIELPPQIHDIPFDCEREYLSFEHALNRLTVYLGSLKQAKKSAVVLPGPFVLKGDEEHEIRKGSALNYVFEVDPAVTKAGLAWKLADEKTLLHSDERGTLLTSDELKDSPFFKARYELVEAVENNFDKILAVLKWEKAGSVVLRAAIPPEQYWKERNRYEKQLTGDQQFHVFLFKDEALICRKMK